MENPPAAVVFTVEQPTIEEAVEDRLQDRAGEVYDGENHAWIKTTHAEQEEARHLHERLAGSLLTIAVTIREMRDRRLYLHLGVETWDQYCNTLPFGRRQAERFAAIAAAFAPQLRLGEAGDLATTWSQTSQNGQESAVSIEEATVLSETLDALGMGKARELATRLAKDELDALLAGETLFTADGRAFDLGDILDMRVRDVTRTLSEMRREYRSKLQRNEERALEAEARAEVLQERLAAAEGDLSLLRQDEAMFSRRLSVEGQLRTISIASDQLTKLNVTLVQISDLVEDALDCHEAVAQQTAGIVGRLENIWRNFAERTAVATSRI